MTADHWQQQRERGNRFFLNVLAWIVLHLGRNTARCILVPVTFYFYLTGRRARRASRDYLKRVYGRRPRAREVFRHFYWFALVSVDRLLLLTGRHRGIHVEMYGEMLHKNLKRWGRGGLLFVSHVGSFDVMRVPAVRAHSLPVRVLMDRDHNSMAMQLIERLDPELASRVIDTRRPPSELVLKLNDYIAEGNMIGVMVDRLREGEEGIECEFLGSPVKLPAGPWHMALALKVPVVFCFSLYHGKGRYSVHFELATEGLTPRRAERRAVIAEQAQRYCRRLEHYLAMQPENWFNFYDFWYASDSDEPSEY
jgi:predicted LPLAT superfamily acyltransferase